MALCAAAFGQASYTAQVRGVVTDQTGAALPNATVIITNDGTNISLTAHTDERGFYILTGLRPDKYTIKVEVTGFQAAESKNVVLAVDQQATLNFALKPSTVSRRFSLPKRRRCSIRKTRRSAPMSPTSMSAIFRSTTAAFTVWFSLPAA